ncbi:GlcG/HbpS family heme-binding protein [Ferruginivarius sediminum]|uniref:Heme-binding protein n=1 Tax=Ferruginivarius sediminum TaxID=2661937 RepID=A0A369T5N1_9PROT|nr:heme-binding protein [Ferruginivarius sediminum]RDD60578.1 heme-binding protein [Ferruginivarius sediminum]
MLSIPRLSLADARRLIEGAAGKARDIGVPMCIAVTDESGNLIAFERMDGAKILSVTLAQNKAMTAAIARKPTADYNANCIPGNLTFGIHTALEGRFSVMGGGLPVFEGEQVVGAIGLSSGTPEQDIACAEAGLAHYRNGG